MILILWANGAELGSGRVGAVKMGWGASESMVASVRRTM